MPDPAHRAGRAHPRPVAGAWIAALVTGVVVWGLIFYVVVRYRRRSDDEIPVQTRYNLPLEIFYTIAPVIMVVVFFSTPSTPRTTCSTTTPTPTTPSRSSASSGRGRSTTLGERTRRRRPSTTVAYDRTSTTAGTGADIPTLWLPVDETIAVQPALARRHPLFWVPGFLMKMDVIPGRAQPLLDHADRDGHLRGQVLPSSAASTTRGCSSTSRSSAASEYDDAPRRTSRTPGRRPTCRCSAATTPTTQAGLEPTRPRRDE